MVILLGRSFCTVLEWSSCPQPSRVTASPVRLRLQAQCGDRRLLGPWEFPSDCCSGAPRRAISAVTLLIWFPRLLLLQRDLLRRAILTHGFQLLAAWVSASCSQAQGPVMWSSRFAWQVVKGDRSEALFPKVEEWVCRILPLSGPGTLAGSYPWPLRQAFLLRSVPLCVHCGYEQGLGVLFQVPALPCLPDMLSQLLVQKVRWHGAC